MRQAFKVRFEGCPASQQRPQFPFPGIVGRLTRLAGRVVSNGPKFWSRSEKVDMSKTMPISEVKTRLPELVSGVAEREEEIVVTRNGKPAAVLVNYNEYERLKNTLDILCHLLYMVQVVKRQLF